MKKTNNNVFEAAKRLIAGQKKKHPSKKQLQQQLRDVTVVGATVTAASTGIAIIAISENCRLRKELKQIKIDTGYYDEIEAEVSDEEQVDATTPAPAATAAATC